MLAGQSTLSRRRFIAATSAGLALIPALNLLAGEGGAPQLEESDPIAVAFGYSHDANAVDTVRFPKRATDEGKTQFCDNCLQYANAEEQDGWGPCAIFPGKIVAAKGWCNVWVAQQ